jgi:hypothetical protein
MRPFSFIPGSRRSKTTTTVLEITLLALGTVPVPVFLLEKSRNSFITERHFAAKKKLKA